MSKIGDAPDPVGNRALSRAQARRTRALARQTTAAASRATQEMMDAALARARRVMNDKAMIQLLYAHGIASVPRAIAPGGRPQRDGRHASAGNPLDSSIDFVIAWTFLLPLFKNSEIATYLDTAWPGFMLQMKDAFIAVVVEGPFPHAISGYRGRRRQGDYFGYRHRPVASKRQNV